LDKFNVILEKKSKINKISKFFKIINIQILNIFISYLNKNLKKIYPFLLPQTATMYTAERCFHKRQPCTLHNATSTNGDHVHCRTPLLQTATMYIAERHFHKRRLCTLQNATFTMFTFFIFFVKIFGNKYIVFLLNHKLNNKKKIMTNLLALIFISHDFMNKIKIIILKN